MKIINARRAWQNARCQYWRMEPPSTEARRRWHKGRLLVKSQAKQQAQKDDACMPFGLPEDATAATNAKSGSEEARKRWHKGRQLVKRQHKMGTVEDECIARRLAANAVEQVRLPVHPTEPTLPFTVSTLCVRPR